MTFCVHQGLSFLEPHPPYNNNYNNIKFFIHREFRGCRGRLLDVQLYNNLSMTFCVHQSLLTRTPSLRLISNYTYPQNKLSMTFCVHQGLLSRTPFHEVNIKLYLPSE